MNEDINIQNIRNILYQLKTLLNDEENNICIIIKDLEEILVRSKELNKLDKIVKQEHIMTSMLINGPS